MTEAPSPEAANTSAVCPSCNRYVGTASRCPYCHVDAPKPFMLRLLRIGSVVLAVAGLALLYLAVTHRQMPVQSIGEITPLMNYAYVRLVGQVPRDAYVGDDDGVIDYVGFTVKDATGSLRVKAYGAVALELSELDLVPRRGMQVDVAGGLMVVKDKGPELRLRTARHLKITAPQQ